MTILTLPDKLNEIESQKLNAMRTDKWLPDVESFAKKAGHFKVQDLIQLMRVNGVPISRATVYRAVNKLLFAGKIIQISHEKERVFEFVKQQVHYHFRCKNCGTILEFYSDEIDNSIRGSARKLKILLSEQKLILEGFCKFCSRGKSARKRKKQKKCQ
ncbi:MAG: transcriptional repressor [Candidatus Omnitrophica bacterium]|nr:transcriptional repressor [Candidatus Omnitrophota bacterium]MCM8816157.1 transcriptional repressor [Candidatus Omnitrophota bacterium]